MYHREGDLFVYYQKGFINTCENLQILKYMVPNIIS